MKVVFTKNLIQSEKTPKTEIQLIDGIRYNWNLRSECMKQGETFQQWLVRTEEYIKSRPTHKYVVGVVVHDFQALVPVESNVDGDMRFSPTGGMIIRYAYLNKLK